MLVSFGLQPPRRSWRLGGRLEAKQNGGKLKPKGREVEPRPGRARLVRRWRAGLERPGRGRAPRPASWPARRRPRARMRRGGRGPRRQPPARRRLSIRAGDDALFWAGRRPRQSTAWPAARRAAASSRSPSAQAAAWSCRPRASSAAAATRAAARPAPRSAAGRRRRRRRRPRRRPPARLARDVRRGPLCLLFGWAASARRRRGQRVDDVLALLEVVVVVAPSRTRRAACCAPRACARADASRATSMASRRRESSVARRTGAQPSAGHGATPGPWTPGCRARRRRRRSVAAAWPVGAFVMSVHEVRRPRRRVHAAHLAAVVVRAVVRVHPCMLRYCVRRWMLVCASYHHLYHSM